MAEQPGFVVLGASSGFGAALASDLAEAGYPVVAGARRPHNGQRNLCYRQVDVTDEAGLRGFFCEAHELLGVPAGLVYCPSDASGVARAWEVSLADVQRVLDVSFLGFVRCTQSVVPAMIDTGGGSVLAVGSRAAREPVDLLAAYCSAKAALEQYVRCLARELADTGVRVNAIGIAAETGLAWGHRSAKEHLRGRPTGHPPLPDVADSLPLARFLLSTQAGHITGQVIEARQPSP